jgi:hypothetical protein
VTGPITVRIHFGGASFWERVKLAWAALLGKSVVVVGRVEVE